LRHSIINGTQDLTTPCRRGPSGVFETYTGHYASTTSSPLTPLLSGIRAGCFGFPPFQGVSFSPFFTASLFPDRRRFPGTSFRYFSEAPPPTSLCAEKISSEDEPSRAKPGVFFFPASIPQLLRAVCNGFGY